jgi:hypothetical protein
MSYFPVVFVMRCHFFRTPHDEKNISYSLNILIHCHICYVLYRERESERVCCQPRSKFAIRPKIYTLSPDSHMTTLTNMTKWNKIVVFIY